MACLLLLSALGSIQLISAQDAQGGTRTAALQSVSTPCSLMLICFLWTCLQCY